MDKVIVVVFNSELKAYEGSRALQDLHNEGSISIYAKAVIARDASGKVAVKQQNDEGPVGTAVGLLTGSMVGLIGGPVGLAIGAGIGMYGGVLYDLAHVGIGEDFLYEVEQSLLPGKAAVVAELWEEWTTPVDTRMEALGGVVFRRMRGEIVDAQIERDAATLNAEFDELEAELAEMEAELDQETAAAKARLQAKINAARAKQQAMRDTIQARIEASQQETEAKIKSLQAQAAKERGERKAKREARIAELKADQQRRSDQLKEAWKLTKGAMS